MAPRKRKTEVVEEAAKNETTSARMTRSATRRVNPNSAESDTKLAKAESVKKPKKAKVAEKKTKTKEEAKAEEETKSEKETADEETGGDESEKRTIVIEHCKQCNQFKMRAIRVKDALEKDVLGITVVLNPEKPRRGCFEIREEGGETFISLLDMKRPFKPMKDLDMSKVITDIVDKLK